VTAHTQIDDLDLLIAALPATLQAAVRELPPQSLLEIVLDLGRLPQARLDSGTRLLAKEAVSYQDLDFVVSRLGEFNTDNRAGIAGTLHRMSAIRNRTGRVVGLTLRVGRAVTGTIEPIRHLFERGISVLLLGPPGVGKTTRLREAARVLADDLGQRVIVVDTSNEIAGDGDVAHPAIGGARRMQVPRPDRQHAVMIEAVENHMPQVIVIDEIGTEHETMAARTIAERGVQLIATAHGNTLENLVSNPTLADLVGGVQTVTLGDDEARLRGSQKTINERMRPPTFDAVVEIVNRDEVIVHEDTADAVDTLLRGYAPQGVRLHADTTPAASEHGAQRRPELSASTVRIYPYAVSRDSVERVIRQLRLDARCVPRAEHADMVLALKSRAEDRRLRQALEGRDLPLYLVRKNTTAQMRRVLQNAFNILHGVDETEVQDALREVREAASTVLAQKVEVELRPRPPALRRLQHRVATDHDVAAESVGSEPDRRLIIRPH
jgi:stage III sporulation protein SpoIIIAA